MILNKIKSEYIFLFFITVSFLIIFISIAKNSDRVIFPPTLVINLDSRPDRMDEINSEFDNWPVKVERVSAVKQSPGWKGCSASHLKSIRLAKERNYPWVLVIEDDCILTQSSRDQFTTLLPYLWANRSQWDIFYGGTTFLKSSSRVSYFPPIYQVKGFTTHFCLIHNKTYDKILYSYPKKISDYIDPIDVFYANNFRIWTSTPFFAKQRPSKSDISDNELEDYGELFSIAEKTLLSL